MRSCIPTYITICILYDAPQTRIVVLGQGSLRWPTQNLVHIFTLKYCINKYVVIMTHFIANVSFTAITNIPNPSVVSHSKSVYLLFIYTDTDEKPWLVQNCPYWWLTLATIRSIIHSQAHNPLLWCTARGKVKRYQAMEPWNQHQYCTRLETLTSIPSYLCIYVQFILIVSFKTSMIS